MKSLEQLEAEQWSVSQLVGFEHPFFNLDAQTITHTWILLIILSCLLIVLRWLLTRKNSIGQFMILSFISSFIDLVTQAIGFFSFSHFSFITGLFSFILFCNILSIIPWLEEPTNNINTTLSLGIISFMYVQITAIRTHGIRAYILEYFAPFFIMLPLHIVGKLASIISISFRLFGNIFGGSIISSIYFNALSGSFIWETLGILSGINFIILLFFGLFEGFLQAFVFSILSLTYLAIALQGESEK